MLQIEAQLITSKLIEDRVELLAAVMHIGGDTGLDALLAQHFGRHR